jgi:hypothetical protein
MEAILPEYPPAHTIVSVVHRLRELYVPSITINQTVYNSMRMKNCFLIASILIAFACMTSLSDAQSNTVSGSGEFSLQGQLTTTSGTAITDGMHMLSVSIYAAGNAQAIFSEVDTVATTNGIFSAMIGGNSSSALHLNGNTQYQLGLSVDGQAELLPRIMIGQVPQAMTAGLADTASLALNANLALNSKSLNGYTIDTLSIGMPHSLLALNGQGKVNAGVLDSSVITTINGLHGAVNITGGGNLSVNTLHDSEGTLLNLSFTGSGGGLLLPFSQSLSLGSGDAFSITNLLSGSAAAFTNAGTGTALRASSLTGSAISASSTGALSGSATIAAQSTLGTAMSAASSSGSAINASASGATKAVLQLQATGTAASSTLISAANADSAVFNVAANGATQINSSAATALQASTSATGGTAAKLTGGLTLVGPTGAASITAGQTSAVINNAYAKANSMVFVTLTSAAGISVPLTVTSVTNGSFTIAPVGGLSLMNTLSFNYLIVNSQ